MLPNYGRKQPREVWDFSFLTWYVILVCPLYEYNINIQKQQSEHVKPSKDECTVS